MMHCTSLDEEHKAQCLSINQTDIFQTGEFYKNDVFSSQDNAFNGNYIIWSNNIIIQRYSMMKIVNQPPKIVAVVHIWL